MEIKTLIETIIAILVLTIMIVGFTAISNSWEENITNKKCQQSVLVHAKSQFSFQAAIQHITGVEEKDARYNAIDCPVKEITLKGSDEEVKKEIADEMKTCWDNFLRGKEPLFKDEGLFCHPCAILDFKDDDGVISGIAPYMIKNRVPGTTTSYFSYLGNYESKSDATINQESINQITSSSLDRSKDHAIVFVYARGDEKGIKKYQQYLDSTPGQVKIASGVAGAGTVAAVVFGLTPAGWVAYTAVGVVITASVLTYKIADFFQEKEVPYMSFVSLEEYNSENLNKVCDVLPIRAIPK